MKFDVTLTITEVRTEHHVVDADGIDDAWEKAREQHALDTSGHSEDNDSLVVEVTEVEHANEQA